MANISLDSSIQLIGLLEFGRDYCSDHLGRFFQNKYSPITPNVNKFEMPAKFVQRNEQDCFAICVMMNNCIMDLKYFSDIFPDWKKEVSTGKISSGEKLEKINTFINDQRLLPVIKNFQKINDEIVIGQCREGEFTPFI
jgi:hypothetical protein